MNVVQKKQQSEHVVDAKPGSKSAIICPWCDSIKASVISPFGGSVSEVLMQCDDCKQSFGWMKWHSKARKA